MLHCASSDLCKEQSRSYHNEAQKNARVCNITLDTTETRSEVWNMTEIAQGKGTKNRSCYDG